MQRPNPNQIRAAAAILKQFAVTTKGTASEAVTENTVYSIAAALGAPGEPSQEYSDAVAKATSGDIKTISMIEGDINEFVVKTENPLGLPVGASYVIAAPDTDDEEDEKPAQDTDVKKELSIEELGKLNKENLVAAVNEEIAAYYEEDAPQIDDTYGTKAEIIESVTVLRKERVWPENDEEEPETEDTNTVTSDDDNEV